MSLPEEKVTRLSLVLRMNSQRAALWALIVIFTANFFNYLDRQLVSAVERQISAGLVLEEWEFGLLWTLFTVGYMVCALPIGYLADRFSRPRLFALCVAIWSVATLATGMATWKPILFGSRVFIGIGEAGCLVIGPSLISDLFARHNRGRALSLFYLGMPLGGTAAFILAAVLFYFDRSWRELFYLAGAPGFIIALLIWLLPDPGRGASEADAALGQHGAVPGGLADYVQLLRNRTLILIILAQAAAVTILVPLIHFGKKYFMDRHALSEQRASMVLLLVMAAGAVGNSVSGLIGDRLARRYKGAYALLAGVGFLAAWPCLVVGLSSEAASIYLPALAVGSFFCFLCMPAVNTQIANVVNPAQRGAAWALAVFILHLLGDTLAPPVFGAVSKEMSRQVAFLGFSFALVPAILFCFVAAVTARGDTARAVTPVEEVVRA
jgi:MFS family permease